MADWSQFDEMDEMKEKRPIECAVCEAMCPDAVDGTMNEAERRVFERHVAECAGCAREFEEAQRGSAWLGMLKGHTPEPPAALLAKILAETTGAESVSRAAAVTPPMRDEAVREWGTQGVEGPAVVPVRETSPAWALGSIFRRMTGAFRIEKARTTFQPRLAMTAAMAFVSIALTLNLTGVRLRNLHASSFTPSGLRRTVMDASASVARSFQSMRVVYQVESRVSELRGEGPLAGEVDQTEQQAPVVQSQPSGATTNEETAQPAHSTPAPRHKGL